jgi:pentatricopeptide repeat protein
VCCSQGAKPLVYHADDLAVIIKAAGAAGDTALIADAWTRLQQDCQQTPTTAAPAAMLLPDGSSSSAKSKQPSPAAFKAVIKAYVDSKDFGKALQLIADMEEVHGGTRAVSVYGGLSFLPIDELKREEDIAAVFTQLKARKVGSC